VALCSGTGENRLRPRRDMLRVTGGSVRAIRCWLLSLALETAPVSLDTRRATLPCRDRRAAAGLLVTPAPGHQRVGQGSRNKLPVNTRAWKFSSAVCRHQWCGSGAIVGWMPSQGAAPTCICCFGCICVTMSSCCCCCCSCCSCRRRRRCR
jgi:hypothetical protein